MSTLPDHLAAARLKLSRDRPYLSAVLWAFVPREVKGMAAQAAGPIGVDQWLRLYFDSEALAAFTVPELAGVLYHECAHVLRDHAGRAEALGIRYQPTAVEGTEGRVALDEALLWNICGDLELNDDLVAEGVVLPKGALVPSLFKEPDDDFAEEYYERLRKTAVKAARQMAAAGAAKGACGSGAGGAAGPWEDGLPSDGKGAGAEGSLGVSHAEADLLRQKVAEDVREQARSRGTVPAWLARWADERLTPKVDWRRTLRARIRQACGSAKGLIDYSYARPSRRQAAVPNVVLPTMVQPTPQVAVVIDTSGSMGTADLARALAEVEGVLAACGQREGVRVLACDAAASPAQRVFHRSQVHLTGGGGTDMRVGVREALGLRPRPHAIIVISDGMTPWPAEPTPTPLIIVLTQAVAEGSAPTWATTVVAEA